jgi:hypothetical protein
MHYRRHSIAACVMALCLIVIAGCGSNATAEFKTGYAAARAPLNRTFVEVARTFSNSKGKTISEITRSLGTLSDRFRKELAPFQALKPPASVATAYTTLTTSLNRVNRDLREIYVAVKGRNLAVATLALAKLRSDAGAASDAAAAITHKLNHA